MPQHQASLENRVLRWLEQNPDATPTATEVARRFGVTVPWARNVLSAMCSAGLLRSQRREAVYQLQRGST